MTFEDLITRLSKVSQSQRLAIYACSFVFVLVLYLFLMLFPSQENMERIQLKIQEHTAKLEETKSKVDTLEGLQGEIA